MTARNLISLPKPDVDLVLELQEAIQKCCVDDQDGYDIESDAGRPLLQCRGFQGES